MKITRRLPGTEGSFVAGNTITQRLPIGLTYHRVHLEYVFTAAGVEVLLGDAVGEIRLMANGKPQWSIQASELDSKNQYEGRAAAAGQIVNGGILAIDFDRYNLRTRNAEEFTSIGTGVTEDPTPLTTLYLEMDLKSASGVNAGSITAKAIQSESRVLGMFKKIRRFIYNPSGAGQFDVADFPRGDVVNMGLFFESANDIDRLEIERDFGGGPNSVFDRTKELNARIQSDGVRVPQLNVFAYDTSEDGNGTDQLTTRELKDLRFKFHVDGAMTLTALMEYIGNLEA